MHVLWTLIQRVYLHVAIVGPPWKFIVLYEYILVVVAVHGRVIQYLLSVLHGLQLFSFVGVLARLEELDERVVGHVSAHADTLSLQLDSIIILLVFFIQSLLLNGITLGVRVKILHIREAHLASHVRSIHKLTMTHTDPGRVIFSW